MSSERNVFKYHIKVDKQIVVRGITYNLERQEREHQETWPDARIFQVGVVSTLKDAQKWEAQNPLTKHA